MDVQLGKDIDVDLEPLEEEVDEGEAEKSIPSNVQFSNVHLSDLTAKEQSVVLQDFDAFPDAFQIMHPSVVAVVGRTLAGKTHLITKYFTSDKCLLLFDHVHIVGRKPQEAYEKFIEAYGKERVTLQLINNVADLVIPEGDKDKERLLIMDDMQTFATHPKVVETATQGCHHDNCTTVLITQSFKIGNTNYRDNVMYWFIFYQPPAVIEEIAKSIFGKDRAQVQKFIDMYKAWVYDREERPNYVLIDNSDHMRFLGQEFQLRPSGLLPPNYPLPIPPPPRVRKAMAKAAADRRKGANKQPVNIKEVIKGYKK